MDVVKHVEMELSIYKVHFLFLVNNVDLLLNMPGVKQCNTLFRYVCRLSKNKIARLGPLYPTLERLVPFKVSI